MVGEGVLHECLNHPDVEQVLIINRRPAGMAHHKLTEIIYADLQNISSITPDLKGYNTCFFCAGVTSVGKKEDEYTRLTYDLTLGFAKALSQLNPEMTFCYISGSGTDGTEQGRLMWARVKGRTENDLKKLPFKAVYNFRPGFLQPTPGLKNTLGLYKYVDWLYPVFKKLFPKYVTSLKQLGYAMINAATIGYEKQIVEVPDIIRLSTYRTIKSPLSDFGAHPPQQK